MQALRPGWRLGRPPHKWTARNRAGAALSCVTQHPGLRSPGAVREDFLKEAAESAPEVGDVVHLLIVSRPSGGFHVLSCGAKNEMEVVGQPGLVGSLSTS